MCTLKCNILTFMFQFFTHKKRSHFLIKNHEALFFISRLDIGKHNMDLFTQLTNLGQSAVSQISISIKVNQQKKEKKKKKKLNDWLKEKYIHCCTISEVKIPNLSNVTCYTQGSSILLQTTHKTKNECLLFMYVV